MATFIRWANVQFHFINHTNGSFTYDLGPLGQSGDTGIFGPGQQGSSRSFGIDGTLEEGNVVLIQIRDDNNPCFRFWSGVDIVHNREQYINLLEENGYTVTRNSSDISEVTGNGFRVTVDGGGVNDPDVSNIYIQVYNA